MPFKVAVPDNVVLPETDKLPVTVALPPILAVPVVDNVVNAPVFGVVLPIGVLLIDANVPPEPSVAMVAPFNVAAPVNVTGPVTVRLANVPKEVTYGCAAVCMVPTMPDAALVPMLVALIVVAVKDVVLTAVAVMFPVTAPTKLPVKV